MKKYLLLVLPVILAACSAKESLPRVERPDGFSDRYTPERVVILSRHGIRSPLNRGGSVLSRITPHKWFNWTSAPSELSRKGAVQEFRLGQYLGRRLEEEGLFPAKWSPAEGEIRLYANALQRTIATSRSFIAGFLPLENIPVEHHGALGTMDPVFSVCLRSIDSLFVQRALHEMDSLALLYRDELRQNYPLLARVLDFDQSAAKAAGDTTRFRLDDIAFELREGEEPQVTGTLCWACRAADALTLQYYEEADDRKAGFGYRLSLDGWRRISAVKEVYQRLLFATPVIARHLAQPMAACLREELTVPGRRFTFLCGHDSNLLSVLSALQAEPYTLPGAVEADTPVSSMLVLRRWKGVDGADYASLSLLYPTAEELRKGADLDRRNPPAEVAISLQGLVRNEDGLYRLEDVLARMDKVISCNPCGNCGQIQNNFVN